MIWIKQKLIQLPRVFRVWFGRCFIYMLGKHGTDEFKTDIHLYNELRKWIDQNKNQKINSTDKAYQIIIDLQNKNVK